MAQVKWQRTVAFALGVTALGTVVIWNEFSRRPQKEASEEETKRLFPLKDTPVESVQIDNGRRSIQANCLDLAAKLCKPGDNSKWELVKPLKAKADDANLNSLLSTLNNLQINESISLKDETPEKRAALLKEYGIDGAAIESGATRKITIKADGKQSIVYLGGTHPISDGIFAIKEVSGKRDETLVYLVPNYLKVNFDRDLTHWREKRILTLAAHEIGSFELNGPKGKISASKKDGQWVMQEGSSAFSGDPENIDSFLSALAFMNARDFVSDNQSDEKATNTLKGARTLLTVNLRKDGADASPVIVSVFEKAVSGAPNPKLYVTASNVDPLFEVDATVRTQLDKSAKDFRLGKFITSMDRFNIKRLEFSGKPIGNSPLVIAQADGKWMDQSSKSEANTDQVQGTLDKLSGNRIKDFLTGAAIPAGESDGIQLKIGDEKSEAKYHFAFWKQGDKLYARDLKSGRKEAFLVDNIVADGLPWARDFYKKAPAQSAAPAKADPHGGEHPGHHH